MISVFHSPKNIIIHSFLKINQVRIPQNSARNRW